MGRDDGFTIPSGCGSSGAWCQNSANSHALEAFADSLVRVSVIAAQHLRKEGRKCGGHTTPSDAMMSNMTWENLMQMAIQHKASPSILYQYITDKLFRKLMHPVGDSESSYYQASELSYEEENALRYMLQDMYVELCLRN